jgi:amino acid transporter
MATPFLVLALFVLLSVIYLVSEQGGGSLLSTDPFTGQGSFSAIASGAAIAAYSFLGFDAVSTLTEDTKDPERNIPRAIMLVALIGGVVFVTVAYTLTLVEPGATFDNADSLAADTARTIGGSVFGAFFVAGLIIGQFTSGLAAQASVSRLLFAMGRDGVLPKGFFGRLSERFATPVLNILLCGLTGLGALFLDVATSTSFINFGAFTAFTLVNLSVIGYFLRHRDTGLSPVMYVAVPLVGALVDIYLLTKLDSTALLLGLSWLAVGVVYLLVLTRGLRVPPPEMSLAE